MEPRQNRTRDPGRKKKICWEKDKGDTDTRERVVHTKEHGDAGGGWEEVEKEE